MSRSLFTAKKHVIAIPEPIEVGGTDAITADAALIALEGISQTDKDVANGIATLDSNLKVKVENLPFLNISADTVDSNIQTVGINTINDFLISNYDTQREYTLIPINGLASLYTYDNMIADSVALGAEANYNQPWPPGGVLGYNPFSALKLPGTITYTTGDTPGAGGFILNGKNFNINIVLPYLEAPVILSPLTNAIITQSHVTIALARVIYAFGSGSSRLMNRYQFELAEDPSFTINVQQSGNLDVDINLLMTHEFTNLITNKLYYIRARVTTTLGDGSGGFIAWTDWSAITSFVTDIASQFQEIQILTDANEVNYEKMGTVVHLSQDGTLLAVGETDKKISTMSSAYGSVFLYKKQPDNTFVLNAELFSPNVLVNVGFGAALSVSGDKTTLFTSAPTDTFNINSDGKVYAYRCTTPGDWTTAVVAYEISPPIPTDNQRFGSFLKCAKQANVLGIWDWNYELHIFSFSDTAATLQATITPPVLPNVFFGWSFDFSANGQRLIVSAQESFHTLDVYGTPITCGAVYVYDYDGTTWNLTASLFPNNPDDQGHQERRFGSRAAISPDGTEIIVCQDYGQNPYKFIYAFKLTNTTWDKTQEFLPSAWLLNYTAPIDIVFSANSNTFAVSSGNTFDCVTIYEKQIDQWVEIQTFKASDAIPDYDQEFGWSMGMSGDGSILACGSSNRNGLVTYGSGGVYIYKK